MKKIQKMLAFTAVFAVLSAEVAINPVPVFSAEKELSDTQETSSVLAGDDSYIDLSPIFPNGNAGTKENPYVISSVYDFEKLRDASLSSSLEDKYFVLTSDITFNNDSVLKANSNGVLSVSGTSFKTFSPISPNANFPFKGHIDGKGHRLRGLILDQSSGVSGLFGYTENADIKNICIERSLLYMHELSGGIAANAKGTTEISGCSFSGTAVYKAQTGRLGSYAGGIVGKLESGASITKCENNAVFSVTEAPMEYFFGGIVGSNAGTVSVCTNKGYFNAVSSIGTIACGGIAGENTANGVIEYCQNQAPLYAKITNYVAGLYIGGLIGQNEGTARNVRNLDTITATGFDAYPCYVGGIAGYNKNGSISAADNRASVTGTLSYAGGLVGAQMADGAAALLSDCLNAGDVSSPNGISGGLIGWNGATGLASSKGTSIVKNSVNTDTQGTSNAAFGAQNAANNGSLSAEFLYAVDKTQDGVTTLSLEALAAADSLNGLDSALWTYPHNGFAPAPVITKQNERSEVVGLWIDAENNKVAFSVVGKDGAKSVQAIIAYYIEGQLIGTSICTADMTNGITTYTVSSPYASQADEIRIAAFGSLVTLSPTADMARF